MSSYTSELCRHLTNLALNTESVTLRELLTKAVNEIENLACGLETMTAAVDMHRMQHQRSNECEAVIIAALQKRHSQ